MSYIASEYLTFTFSRRFAQPVRHFWSIGPHTKIFQNFRSPSDPESGLCDWPEFFQCRISPQNTWILRSRVVLGTKYVISGPLDHVQKFSKISVRRRIRKVACGPSRDFQSVVYRLRMPGFRIPTPFRAAPTLFLVHWTTYNNFRKFPFLVVSEKWPVGLAGNF